MVLGTTFNSLSFLKGKRCIRTDVRSLIRFERFIEGLFDGHGIILGDAAGAEVVLHVGGVDWGNFAHGGEFSFHEGLQAGHDFRVLAGDVGLFVGVRLQVEELHFS